MRQWHGIRFRQVPPRTLLGRAVAAILTLALVAFILFFFAIALAVIAAVVGAFLLRAGWRRWKTSRKGHRSEWFYGIAAGGPAGGTPEESGFSLINPEPFLAGESGRGVRREVVAPYSVEDSSQNETDPATPRGPSASPG